jgi:hypothetical protein
MIALIFNLILSFVRLEACEFNSQVKSVYSLSAPVTEILSQFSLLKKPEVKGISIFHPIRVSDFSGEILPGGIFLGHGVLAKMKGSIVFYDESFELKKMFTLNSDITPIEIKTRNLTPPLVLSEVELKLGPHVKGCDWKKTQKIMQEKLKRISTLLVKHPYILFFLGHPQGKKWPATLMVNDGIVKWLLDNKLVKTFPSQLSYVQWSSKIMREVPPKHLKVGIKDSGRSFETKIEKLSDGITLTYPGALVPGYGQVDGLIYLFENLKI